jgi:hypothetical protein
MANLGGVQPPPAPQILSQQAAPQADATAPMPQPGKSGSPKFDGINTHETLPKFIKDFEYYANKAGLSEQQKK